MTSPDHGPGVRLPPPVLTLAGLTNVSLEQNLTFCELIVQNAQACAAVAVACACPPAAFVVVVVCCLLLLLLVV